VAGGEAHAAAGRHEQAGDDVQGRGLAATARSEQGEKLPLVDTEVDRPYPERGTIPLDDAVEDQDCLSHSAAKNLLVPSLAIAVAIRELRHVVELALQPAEGLQVG